LTAVPRPTGVAILAILGFIVSILTILAGIGGLVLSAFITGILNALGSNTIASAVAGLAVAILSVGVLLAGLIYLLLSWGLWSGKNWARIIWIIFSILGALGALGVLVAGALGFVVPLLIDIFIIYYLTRAHVKAYFKHMVMMPPPSQPMSK
jgi:hypothetical protein